MSALASCVLDAAHSLGGIDDPDALMASHAQQMPIPGNDDLGDAGHGCSDHMIVINIAARTLGSRTLGSGLAAQQATSHPIEPRCPELDARSGYRAASISSMFFLSSSLTS